ELGLAEDDPRRRAVRLANPLSDAQPFLRTSLLHTLVDAAVRNVGRGLTDLAIYEIGLVTRPDGATRPSPLPGPGYLPEQADLAAIRAAVPDQPLRVAGVLAGHAVLPGVHAQARRADHADAIDAVHRIVTALGVTPQVEADTEHSP